MAFLSAFPCRNSDTSSLSLALFHHFPVPVQPLGLVRLLLGNTIGKGLRPVGHTFNIGSPRGTHVVLWLCCGWERQGAKHLPLAIERYRPTGARRGPGPPSGRVFYAPPCRRAPARPARPGFRLLWPGFGSGLDPVFKGFSSMADDVCPDCPVLQYQMSHWLANGPREIFLCLAVGVTYEQFRVSIQEKSA